MPGRKYSVPNSSYRYGFNGKENDKDAGEGIQDYGLRIYDARLGRFLSADPLEEEYPELTPYQFGSNRPIDGIDLDGAEWTPAELMEILAQAKAALGTLISENTIVLRGISNSVVNANLLGVPDKLGSWGTDNLNNYSTGYDQKLYLLGRVVGDVAAVIQGTAEISGGSSAAAGGLTVSATGVGAVAGLPTAVVGALVAGHGAGTGAAAAIDLGETLGQLQQLGAFSTGAADASKKSPEQITKDKAASAQSKNTGSTAGGGKRQKNKLPDKGGPQNSTLTNKPGTTTKKYNSEGNVTKEWNKGHPDHPKTSKNYRDHVHDYRRAGEPSSRGGARTPKRNEKLKDFKN